MMRVPFSQWRHGGPVRRGLYFAMIEGIVVAGFAPGFVTPSLAEALAGAVRAGVTVLQSTRAGSGRVFPTTRVLQAGLIPADNLTPQKARILLALALTVTRDPAGIARIVATY